MSVTNISPKNKLLLWVKAGGRCEYQGCNKAVYLDIVTNRQYNAAYIAHIVADSPGGPRGDSNRSALLANDLSNLMLLCDVHHTLIDIDDVDGNPETRLLAMKKLHEERIERLTAIDVDRDSHIILYGENIGSQNPVLSYNIASTTVVPNRYPAESHAIELGLKNSDIKDGDQYSWDLTKLNLKQQFDTRIKPRIASGEIRHISLFALAPQPLLIKLGRLLRDFNSVDVYQKLRIPDTWNWEDDSSSVQNITLNRPDNKGKQPILIFSISADIYSRVKNQYQDTASIWEIRVAFPQLDALRTKKQLDEFKKICALLLNEIKNESSYDTLKVYCAMPNSAAIELGRIWNPKVDLRLQIYDCNKPMSKGDSADIETITIENII